MTTLSDDSTGAGRGPRSRSWLIGVVTASSLACTDPGLVQAPLPPTGEAPPLPVYASAAPPLQCGADAELAVSFPTRPGVTYRVATIVPAALFQTLPGQDVVVASSTQSALTVRAMAAPHLVVPGQTVFGSLRVESSEPSEPPIHVPLSFTPEGALLSAPSVVDLGQAPLASESRTASIEIVNRGNAPARVTPRLASPTGAFALPPATLELAPNEAKSAMLTFRPTASGTDTASVKFDVEGAACQTLATTFIRGSVTGGAIGVSPGVLDFGATECGSQASPKTVSLTNYGAVSVTVEGALVLGDASPYAVEPSKLDVSPGTSVAFTVTPKPHPVSTASVDDVLVIRAGSERVLVPLHQAWSGYTLSAPAKVDLGRIPLASPGSGKPLVVKNEGTLPAVVTPALDPWWYGPIPFIVAPATPITVPPGAEVALQITAEPLTLNAWSHRLVLEATGVACRDLPPAVTLEMQPFARAVAIRTHGGPGFDAMLEGGGAQRFGNYAPTNGTAWTAASSIHPDDVAMPAAAGAGALCVVRAGTPPRCVADFWFPEAQPALAGATRYGRRQTTLFALIGSELKAMDLRLLQDATVGPALDFAMGDSISGSIEACFVRPDRTVACWGRQTDEIWGAGPRAMADPFAVPGITEAKRVAYGRRALCVIDTSDVARCVGNELTPSDMSVPVTLVTDAVELAVYSDEQIACARRADGTVWCYGRSSHPLVSGMPGATHRTVATVPGLVAKELFQGGSACALATDGRVACWKTGALTHFPGLD